MNNVNYQSELKLRSCIKNRIPAYIVGGAGSGKTTKVIHLAQEFKLSYYSISVSGQTSKSDLFGFVDAGGKYRPSLFRIAYEKGGVFLMDEIDAGNANVIVSINQAIGNKVCGFPDGKMIPQHKDFVFIASGNTVGTGANKDYIGRNALDGASLDRFIEISWKYNEELESSIATNPYWVKRVQTIRKVVSELGIRLIVSPRASINGSLLINDGIELSEVEESAVFKGQVDSMTKQKIIAIVNDRLNHAPVPVIKKETEESVLEVEVEVKKEKDKKIPVHRKKSVKQKNKQKTVKKVYNITEETRKARSERMKLYWIEKKKVA